jgi:hypothetical protein
MKMRLIRSLTIPEPCVLGSGCLTCTTQPQMTPSEHEGDDSALDILNLSVCFYAYKAAPRALNLALKYNIESHTSAPHYHPRTSSHSAYFER